MSVTPLVSITVLLPIATIPAKSKPTLLQASWLTSPDDIQHLSKYNGGRAATVSYAGSPSERIQPPLLYIKLTHENSGSVNNGFLIIYRNQIFSTLT